MAVYSVHEPEGRSFDPAADVVFVRSGFSAAAVVFGVLWFVWHRMWLGLGLYILVLFALGFAGVVAQLHPTGIMFMQSLVAITLGFQAAYIRRWHLERRGIREVAVTSGRNLDAAEIQFFSGRYRAAMDSPHTLPVEPSSAPGV